MEKVKNHKFLLELFSLYNARNQNSILLLIGDGSLRDELEEYSKGLNIDDKVIITDINGRVWYEMWYGGLENGKPLFYRWDDEMYNCFMPEAVAWRYPLEPYKEEISE